MASHPSNANDEVEHLRKGIQERDARIKDLQQIVFEHWAATHRFGPSASHDTGPTDAQRVEAAATIADLPGKLAAALATYQNLLQVKEAAIFQAKKECGDLELQQRITVEAMTALIDEAHSTLDRAKEEKRLTSGEKFELFDTALNEIADKGSESLHRVSSILQSEPEGSQSYKESMLSLTLTPKAGLSDHQPKDVQAPASAASSENKPVSGPTMPPAPQPQAPSKRRVATGTLLPLSEEEPRTIPSISGAVLRDREARKQAKAASTVKTPAQSGV